MLAVTCETAAEVAAIAPVSSFMRAATSPIEASISTAELEVSSAVCASCSTLSLTSRIDLRDAADRIRRLADRAGLARRGLAELPAALLERARDRQHLGDALTHLRDQAAQAGGHRVEGARELAELAARRLRHLHREIAAGHRRRRRDLILERACDVPAQPVRERERQEQRARHHDAHDRRLGGQLARQVRRAAADPQQPGWPALDVDLA